MGDRLTQPTDWRSLQDTVGASRKLNPDMFSPKMVPRESYDPGQTLLIRRANGYRGQKDIGYQKCAALVRGQRLSNCRAKLIRD